MIRGVLFEGVDFVGKTSVATRLAFLLAERGTHATLGKCYLKRSPIIEFLEEKAQGTESMVERDWYYSSAILADLASCTPPDTFVVQDRHWLTQIGRNLFFHAETEMIPPGLLEEKHIPFQFNILLTSSLEAKMERSQGRPAKSPRDRILAANPTLHQDYEKFLVNLLPKNESWWVLDTTDLDIEQVAQAALKHIGL
jgi:thymidylate kinase